MGMTVLGTPIVERKKDLPKDLPKDPPNESARLLSHEIPRGPPMGTSLLLILRRERESPRLQSWDESDQSEKYSSTRRMFHMIDRIIIP
jgi:hypothetical protein